MRWGKTLLPVLALSPLASAAPVDSAKVDAAIAAMRQALGADRVGPARCGADGKCAVAVDGRDVALDVATDPSGRVTVNMRGKIVALDEIEKKANAAAGADTKVACSGPRVRVVVPDDTLSCTASRPGWTHEWTLRAAPPDGTVVPPPGFPLHPEEGVRQNASALLAKPQRILDGPDAAALVQELARSAGQPLEKISCPGKVDVSDGKAATCTSILGGKPLRVRLDVGKGQWRLQPDQLILDVGELEKDAEKSGAEMAKGGTLHVKCGAERTLILDYPAKVACDTELPGGKHRALTATIDGPDAPTRFVWAK